MKVYIGYDSREEEAYELAIASLLGRSTCPVEVTPLIHDRLAASGLLRRPTDLRGQRYDILSNAAASTEFALSRFLPPILCQTGWCAFMDCDVVALADIAELFDLAQDRYAVMCVQHQHAPKERTKMDGQAQTSYPRKNWSSVMLFNCDHPANRRLSLADIQERPGRDLHAFYWLADSEIGALPAEWNWLVGVQERPAQPKIAHFTLGTPNLPGVEHISEHSLWWQEYRRWINPNLALVPDSRASNTSSRDAAA